MRRLWSCLFGAILLLLATHASAFAERRVALVIGNGAYANAPHLPNPPHDAEDVAAALERSGFATILGVDLDQLKMQDAIIRFARAERTADVALFYYSGHAMQFGGINYLMPIDASLADEADLRRLVRVDDIAADLQQAKNLRILVLDSCRNNPLADDLKRSIGLTRGASVARGLAKIQSPEGTIVAYSTQAGKTAEDGNGRNSPYTGAFLRHVEEHAEIGAVFRRVSADVYEATGRQQLPELSLSLIGEYYLNGNAQPALATTQPEASKSASAPISVDRCAGAETHWKAADSLRTIAAYEDHRRRFPDCAFAGLAAQRIEALHTQLAALPTPSRDAHDLPEILARRGWLGVEIMNVAADAPAGSGPAHGAQVVKAYDEGAAKAAGIEPGDVVVALNGHEIRDAGALARIVRDLPAGIDVDLDLIRAGGKETRRLKLGAYADGLAAGNAQIMAALGSAYYSGDGVARDFVEAGRWYAKSAAAGDVDAMNDLGWLYQNGQGVAQDYGEARRWYERAAAGGNAMAMNRLGWLYGNGKGVALDYGEARTWYEQAAARGNAWAMSNLGVLYENGSGVRQDNAQARLWYEKGAAAGNAAAMRAVGWFYQNGKGVRQDYGEAWRWYEKSAAAGNTVAMNDLGWLAQSGKGVRQDYGEARRWYEKAAAAGNPVAMYNLGLLYQNGKGARRDYGEARRWYEKAAAGGVEAAREKLRR
jgi:TPR repeat protein/uncharacterized caspase-like protein